ncbi:hypothetical protein [Thiothrix winogradskyi]|uniref:hypothetical protein n=1 Tax=Thiothrix winogradskyi TaxID=96472 RepID=UPI002882D46A|nr:hypothetical protein [Thiothrix winogradskyi]
MKPERSFRQLVLALAIGAAFSTTAAFAVTDQDIADDAKTTDNVVSYGMGLQGQRFSPLDKLNAETVKNLVPAYVLSFGDEKQRG